MDPIHSIKFAMFLLALSPVAGFAAGPATQPAQLPTVSADVADAQPSNPDSGASGASDEGNRPHRRPMMRFAPVSEKEKTDAMLYMKAHSPNRFTAIDSLPDGKNKTNAEELAARNYLNWMQIMREDNDLYAVVQKRVAVEDQIFGLLTDLQKDGPDKADATKAKIKDAVGALVDVGLQERQLRLSRLQKTLAEQQQKLAEDSKRRDDLIEERFKNVLSEEKALVPNAGGSSGSGQHGRNGPRPPGQ